VDARKVDLICAAGINHNGYEMFDPLRQDVLKQRRSKNAQLPQSHKEIRPDNPYPLIFFNPFSIIFNHPQ
jgi:hypothetical protein